MIFVSVGTFIKGFDELVSAMDDACAQAGLGAFAQIGNSSVLPQHMQYSRFLTLSEMQARLQQAQLVVCHGGFGIIGDAMRAQRPIIAVPRQTLSNSANAPANNQLVVVQRLQELYGIHVCTDMRKLAQLLPGILHGASGQQNYNLHCNIPALIGDFLART